MKQLTCLPDLYGGHHRELTTRPLSALQLENPDLSDVSKTALNAQRGCLRSAGRFATVVGQCKSVVDKGGDQSVELVKLGAGRDGRFVLEDWWQRGTERDCHYVFRATPLQSKGWRFHAVAYTVQDGVGAWSEDVSEVHAGYEVRVGQAASGTKMSRKERRAAKALSAAAGSSSSVMFLDANVNGFTEAEWVAECERERVDPAPVRDGERPFTPAEWRYELENYLQEEREGQLYDLTGMTGEQLVEWDKKVQKGLEEDKQKVKQGTKRKQAGEAAKQGEELN